MLFVVVEKMTFSYSTNYSIYDIVQGQVAADLPNIFHPLSVMMVRC